MKDAIWKQSITGFESENPEYSIRIISRCTDSLHCFHDKISRLSVKYSFQPSITFMPTKQPILPYLALFTGIICLSFSAMFGKWANAPGPVIGFYRIGLATIILLPVFTYRIQKTGIKLPKAVLLLPILGGFFTAFDHGTWNSSLRYTSAANATLLGNTAPLWVALFAWLIFRQKLRGLFWIGLVLALGGAVIVLGSDFIQHPSIGMGDLLALAAGVFYAGYFLVTEKGRQKLDTLSYVWLVDLIATFTLLVITISLKMPLGGYPTQSYLAFLGAALISQVGGYLSIGYALGHLPASVVSPTLVGQPVVTALLAIPLLGEKLRTEQWLGGLVVLMGIYLVHRSRERSEAAELAGSVN
jgi:drug/metabolite transporter (DMT)-like permease